MRSTFLIKLFGAVVLVAIAQQTAAQCPDRSSDLTPTIRALLMMERPAVLTAEQWTKVIENPANRQDMQVVIYEEDRFDPCELPQGWWYVMHAGVRPKVKEVGIYE
ncbi:MAG: hypothetical protein QY325_00415 [Flavobacteriales bacterium]|nr:MAG: hypothetical protein QY325_00415 [Flavobacteriales bacterium]